MAKVPSAPHILSIELREVVEGFRSRSKALKHRLQSWKYSSEVDEAERLNVDFTDYRQNHYRLVFWVDGVLWFRVCRMNPGKKGWMFSYSFYGRWEDSLLPKIVEAFEQTASYVFTSSKVDEEQLKALWAMASPGGELF